MPDPETASTQLEEEYRARGYHSIVGLDEVGRGAWAGPVVVGAVILPIHRPDLRDVLIGVRDSKKVTTLRRRNLLAEKVRDTASAWGLGQASASEIDDYGIIGATHLAMHRALEAMLEDFPEADPDLLFLDHIHLPDMPLPQVSRAKMDSLSLTVASASLLAKTYRDDIMIGFDERYPDYDFANNMGYAATSGEDLHRKALARLGPSPIHRLSFKPMQRRLL